MTFQLQSRRLLTISAWQHAGDDTERAVTLPAGSSSGDILLEADGSNIQFDIVGSSLRVGDLLAMRGSLFVEQQSVQNTTRAIFAYTVGQGIPSTSAPVDHTLAFVASPTVNALCWRLSFECVYRIAASASPYLAPGSKRTSERSLAGRFATNVSSSLNGSEFTLLAAIGSLAARGFTGGLGYAGLQSGNCTVRLGFDVASALPSLLGSALLRLDLFGHYRPVGPGPVL